MEGTKQRTLSPLPSNVTVTRSQPPKNVHSKTRTNQMKNRHRRESSNIQELINEVIQSPENCRTGFRAWLCEAKRSPGVEIFLYILFFVTLIFLALDIKGSTTTFFYANLVEDIVVHEEFDFSQSHIKKTFANVGEVSEFWSFIHGPFANAMFNNRQDVCEEEQLGPDCASKRATLFWNDIHLIDIRFKQNRVKRYEINKAINGNVEVCRAPKWIQGFKPDAWNAIQEQGCYPAFSPDYEDKNITFNKTHHQFSSSDNMVPMTKHDETVSDCFEYHERRFDWQTTGIIYPRQYSASGYSCFLNTDSKTIGNATKWLKNLEESRWFDAGTRAVMVDFTVYSANVDQFLFFRVGVEQAPTGGLLPFWDNYAMDLGDVADTKTLVLRLMLGIFCLIFFVQEISEVCVHGFKKHFSDIWNILELLNLLLFGFYFGLLLVAELTLIHERETANFDIQVIGAVRTMADNILALNMIFSSLKVFKYIKVSKRMSLMLTTFYEARYSLFALLVLVMIFLVGYALAFYIAFGHRIDGFRSFSRSFITLFNSILAGLEYQEELQRVNWLLGPFLYFSFQIFVSFVLLSLLIAIIEDAFQHTQNELNEHHEKDQLVAAMKKTGHNMWTNVIGGVRRSAKKMGRLSGSSSLRRSKSEDPTLNHKPNFSVGSLFGRNKKHETEDEKKVGESITEMRNLGDIANLALGKKPKKSNRSTFLQAVIASGEKEKTEDHQKKMMTKRKKRRQSSVKFPVPSDMNSYNENDANEKKEFERDDQRAQKKTNHKINLLENKMDMILASLDALSKTSSSRQFQATTPQETKPQETKPEATKSDSTRRESTDKKRKNFEKKKTRRSSTVLPPNWKKYRAENGDAYYENTETSEVTWDKPSFSVLLNM